MLRRGRLLTEPDIATGSSYTMLTDLATGSSFRVDASPFDALPDDAERLASPDRGPAQLYDDTHFDHDVQAALDAMNMRRHHRCRPNQR